MEAFRQALHTAGFVGGAQVDGFEKEFAEFCGTKYCVGVANGTDAVRFALMASGVGPGDAVVTVSHTFIATVEAISQSGAATEFVDIDERTYCMSPAALEDVLEGLREGRRHRPAASASAPASPSRRCCPSTCTARRPTWTPSWPSRRSTTCW